MMEQLVRALVTASMEKDPAAFLRELRDAGVDAEVVAGRVVLIYPNSERQTLVGAEYLAYAADAWGDKLRWDFLATR